MKWKLVPVEPDEQQIYAMRSAFYRVRRGGAGGQTIDACYQRENAPELAAYSAMLEAAPPAPEPDPELARDAARYRWLLNQAWFQQAADRFDFTDGGMQIRFEKCMDEFIDAAMSGKGGA